MNFKELREELEKVDAKCRAAGVVDCSELIEVGELVLDNLPAILAALSIAERGQWVKCEERLPEESGFYLTIRFPGDHGSDLPFDAGSKGWNCFDGRFNELFPTHWMPLPLPPEEK